MANEARNTREQETRETEARVEQFVPPQILPEITPRDGWEHRWIRVSLVGETDKQNTSIRFREGWEPCSPKEYPEVNMMSDSNSKFKDVIEVGGLVLCRAPVGKVQAREAYYQKSALAQLQSVDNNFMKENDPRMPLFSEKRTKVSFGRG